MNSGVGNSGCNDVIRDTRYSGERNKGKMSVVRVTSGPKFIYK